MVAFRNAYEEYPRWQALALWVEVVITARDSLPTWLRDDLRERCPGFLEHEETSHEPKVMGLHLLEWAHNQQFGFARQLGWLDALTFYGVRRPRLRPLFSHNAKLPRQVMPELKRRFPGIRVKQNSDVSRGAQENSKIWRRLIKWDNDRCLGQA